MSHGETFQFLCNRRMFTLENESIWIQYLLRSHYLPWGWYCEGCTLWCSEKMVALEMPDGLNNRVKIMPWGRGCYNVRPEERFIYFVKWRQNEFFLWFDAPYFNPDIGSTHSCPYRNNFPYREVLELSFSIETGDIILGIGSTLDIVVEAFPFSAALQDSFTVKEEE